MNDFIGGIFALVFIWGLLVYLGPPLVQLLQWFLALIGAY